MVVDDEWLRIGSANINNRSMGVDTECDLAIEAAGRSDVVHAIRTFRNGSLRNISAQARKTWSARSKPRLDCRRN
jgi:phosphatidylserine/phosphatidylglycerophosphate/cardiolipin synthase-like enzyme